MRLLRGAVVAAAAALGLLLAAGCVISALFEIDGFGRGGESPRAGYLLLLGLAFVASTLAPLLLWRLLLPRTAPGLAAAVVLSLMALLIVILGLGVRG